jgi:hypothetical protein
VVAADSIRRLVTKGKSRLVGGRVPARRCRQPGLFVIHRMRGSKGLDRMLLENSPSLTSLWTLVYRGAEFHHPRGHLNQLGAMLLAESCCWAFHRCGSPALARNRDHLALCASFGNSESSAEQPTQETLDTYLVSVMTRNVSESQTPNKKIRFRHGRLCLGSSGPAEFSWSTLGAVAAAWFSQLTGRLDKARPAAVSGAHVVSPQSAASLPESGPSRAKPDPHQVQTSCSCEKSPPSTSYYRTLLHHSGTVQLQVPFFAHRIACSGRQALQLRLCRCLWCLR